MIILKYQLFFHDSEIPTSYWYIAFPWSLKIMISYALSLTVCPLIPQGPGHLLSCGTQHHHYLVWPRIILTNLTSLY